LRVILLYGILSVGIYLHSRRVHHGCASAAGLEIAATKNVRQRGNLWLVPSQSGDDAYKVDWEHRHCTCPDHTIRHAKCKHLYAVEYTVSHETRPDGTITVTKTKRVTYKQNWSAYNAAQQEEKARFAVLLADLCKLVPQPPQSNGRPRLPLADMVFACAYKVYTGFSSRRFTSDLREMQADGNIARTPHFNSVSNYLADPALTPILKQLVILSSLPLKSVETTFSVDSSGFSTCRFIRWFNKKYGREIDNREWVKVHLMCGVDTHIVTSVEISGWEAHDCPFFKPLVEATAAHFQIGEVSGDKAYLSRDNLKLVGDKGGTPYIPFKENTPLPSPDEDSMWSRAYHVFALNRDAFLERYHQRSNVESVFSMVKGKFGDAVRGKSDVAQINEVLCKVLCHNICVVVQAMHELGIETTFGPVQHTALQG
jgi:transposase